MRRLGNKFTGVDKDYVSAAKIIDTNCDLLAIEEDMATTHDTNTGLDALMSAIGSAWGDLVTAQPAPIPATSNSEHYAFLYRKSAVSVCSGWTNAKRFPDPEDIFLREPAWGCFNVHASPRPLVIAGYHAIFGEPAERKREVGFLDDDLDNNGTKDDFFNAMKASAPAGSDIVLAGDFNLTTSEIKEVLPNYIDLTDGNGSTLNDTSGISDNEYDHIIVMPGQTLLTNTKPAIVMDVRETHQPDAGFYQTVSDHLPIRFILE
jgi:endonuclease/exonuclease/phosphatase family metal-dependent hydrolase